MDTNFVPVWAWSMTFHNGQLAKLTPVSISDLQLQYCPDMMHGKGRQYNSCVVRGRHDSNQWIVLSNATQIMHNVYSPKGTNKKGWEP